MVAIPEPPPPDPTLEAMRRALEARAAAEPQRRYIGASGIGQECSRAIWYQINGYNPLPNRSSNVMAIEDGHRTEDLMAERLRLVPGIELWTHKPDGTQYGFDWGFLSGHYDGVILGLLQAPKTPHVWENKAVKIEKFNLLQKHKDELGEKQALQAWDATYYAQAVIYMEAEGLTRHYLTCCTPGGRDVISVRTNANPKMAKALIAKAKRIKTSSEPPARIGDETHFFCKHFCGHMENCHGKVFG